MAIEFIISPTPGDDTQTATFYGSVGEDKRFLIGTGTQYKTLRGLVQETGDLHYDPTDYPQYGQWAQLIDCTAYCESKRVLTCLNTYDRARFTFGCLQFAAHVPDGDFVQWFHLLLQRGEANNYFPDLILVGGRINQVVNGANEPLETAQSSAALMAYLNTDPLKVDAAETLAAARFIYWTMSESAVQGAQIEIGNKVFRATIGNCAHQLGLDGRPDFIISAVMDILHQGRGTFSLIKTALAGSSVDVQLDRLLGIGASAYPSRCIDLSNMIAAKRQSGLFGKYIYSVATNDFHPTARTFAPHVEVADRLIDRSATITLRSAPAAPLSSALALLERREEAELFEGILLVDNNFPGNVLLATGKAEFHSFNKGDILDEEAVDGRVLRLWVRRGAQAWRSNAIQVGVGMHQMRPTIVGMEDLPPPPMELVTGAPDKGMATHRRALLDLASPSRTLAGAAAAYNGSCAGGDHYANNCAHFLSDAFIRAGFSELLPGGSASGFVHARCDTSAKRVIRARDMWAWFQSMAVETSTTLVKNTGLWAVFQLDEAAYWGGHVVIIDTNTWTWYGTASYPQWSQNAYQW